MTGLLQRLAARGAMPGAGDVASDGTVPMTAPPRPRFAPPEPVAEELPDSRVEDAQPARNTPDPPLAREPSRTLQPPTAPPPSPPGLERAAEPPAALAQVATEGAVPLPEPPIPKAPLAGTVGRLPDTAPPRPQTRDATGPSTELPDLYHSTETVPDREERQAPQPETLKTTFIPAAEALPPALVDPVPSEPPPLAEPAAPVARAQPAEVMPFAEMTEPRLSIGRIEVIFEAPPQPVQPALPARSQPQRSRGFDGFAARRLGQRR